MRLPDVQASIRPWLGRHREKLLDACWLIAALNLPKLLLGLTRTPWWLQAMLLGAFVLAAPPRAQAIAAPWRRYRAILPSYVFVAGGGVAAMALWLQLPMHHWAFAPVWLAMTALARLPVAQAATAIQGWIVRRRIEILLGDLLILLAFTFSTPRWSQLAGPPAWSLLAIIAVWLWLHRLQGTVATKPWRLLGLAATWGAVWFANVDGGWPQVPVFTAWLAIALVAYRRMVRHWYGTAEGATENACWLALGAGTLFWFHPFYRAGVHGAGDAFYYATFLADALEQFRSGVFPVLVGQTEYQFNGAVIPIRIAPGFQYAGGLVDLLTGRCLNPMAVQNIIIVLAAFATVFGTYTALRRLARSSGPAAWLTALFASCPGVLGLAFNSDLYMSWLAAPCVAVALAIGVRTFQAPSARSAAALGFVLGLAWWIHAPIALWLTVVLAAMQALRLVLTWRRGRPWLAEIAVGAAIFLAIAAFPLVSAGLFPADPSAGANGGFVVPANHILQQLLETFPASWLPLSDIGRRLTDFQLGYSLVFVGLFAAVAGWNSKQAGPRGLVIAGACLLLLLLPIPGLTLALWQLVPDAVRSVTNIWVMQRLYLVLAGIIVVLAALTWQASAGLRRAWMVAALLWSAAEAMKFVHGSAATVTPASASPHRLAKENIVLTRYSYGLFARKPAYFTHGTTDPELENRLFDESFTAHLGSNFAAAVASADRSVTYRFTVVGGHIETEQPITLVPGRRYLARLQTGSAVLHGALVLQGRELQRVYGLPEYGESQSFGLGGTHNPWLPLHTTRSEDEVVLALFEPSPPTALGQLAMTCTLRVAEYDARRLPIRVTSWIPYQARVRTAVAAWLETPRMYQSGYAALVDGAAAEICKSPEGLVAVRVPAGEHDVTLSYAAPLGLVTAFWISLASLAGGTLWIVASAIRHRAQLRQS